MGINDLPMDGPRQLERAARLLDFWSNAPRGMRTPVHKSLEQLFGEARGRLQPHGVLGVPPFGPAGASRLLQSPHAQRLDRDVADFSLSGAGAAPTGAAQQQESAADGLPTLGVREFFGLRHERVVLGAMEEAHRDCMRSFERRAFERFQADWEEAKAQIMSTLAPQRLGQAAIGSALRGGPGGDRDAGLAAVAAPPQDAAIINLLLRERFSPALVQRIARLSCESCQPYQAELAECWTIVGHALRPTPPAIVSGSIAYLQGRFGEDLRTAVYRSADARLGGIPDAWALVRAFGRVKFGTAAFPSAPAHVWYAAYVAARAGLSQLLLELPERAAPSSDRCPVLRTVCVKVARLLRAAATEAGGPAPEFEAAGDVDQADLLRADLAEEGNDFRDVLVSLLLGRSFAFGRLPEATVEDWLWFRLHALFVGAGEGESARGSALERQLEGLRRHTLALPPSHYDPAAAAGAVLGGTAGANGPAGAVAAAAAPGFRGVGDGLWGGPLVVGAGAGGISGGATAAGITHTLNFVKVLLLTAQFGRAVQQLRSQDRCLHGPALHIALVLRRAGTLAALEPPEQVLGVAALVRDYAGQFGCAEQLQYFRSLDLPERVEALQGLLLRGGVGTNDELLGCIDTNGRHRPGLLEKTLHEDGLGDRAEFADLCARAGRVAAERGQYREALRLFHLGRCHSEVLQVLCRCLRLPVWREPAAAAADEAALLSQDIQRFFRIYEQNLDRYALSSHAWAVARKLCAARTFHMLCDQGRPEAALDVFDREQLLPMGLDDSAGCSQGEGELLVECPRIIGDYVQILRHAASQGTVNMIALRARVRQLQSFLATHSHHLTLDQPSAAALAGLALF